MERSHQLVCFYRCQLVSFEKIQPSQHGTVKFHSSRTGVTLLYLHSNCCSPTVTCVQKNDSLQKERRGMCDSESLRGMGRRGLRCSKQTQRERHRGKRQIKSPVTFPAQCLTVEMLQEGEQIPATPAYWNIISCIWSHLLVSLSNHASRCFSINATRQYLHMYFCAESVVSLHLGCCAQQPLINSVNALTTGH